jgi:sugar lactone lactonase YvrE
VTEEIHEVEDLLPKLPDRAAALFLLAHDYAQIGNVDKALSLLRECLSLDEGFDPEGDFAFTSLASHAEFRSLLDRVHRRYPVVQRAHVAFTLPEKDLVPEGLAASTTGGTLYMGSLNRRKIVKITQKGDIFDFVKSGQYDIRPVCGLKVDGSDESLWSNTCPDDGAGAELLHFDSAGKLMERFPAPTPSQHLFNDLVLKGRQEIYLTDSLANRAYRFDRKSRAFTELQVCRAVYYPNGIALSDDGNVLYVADAFGVLKVDLRDKSCHEVVPGPSNTVSGTDGLYWYRNSLIAVQNSLGSSRIAQFHLSNDGIHVKRKTILEYKSPLVALPTTGAIVGSKFYFMSNTQVENFKGGKILDPTKLEPIQISVVELEN